MPREYKISLETSDICGYKNALPKEETRKDNDREFSLLQKPLTSSDGSYENSHFITETILIMD